jgi:signal transduction histidine kinase
MRFTGTVKTDAEPEMGTSARLINREMNAAQRRVLAEERNPQRPGLDAGRRDHTVQFYQDDAFFIDGLSRFIGSAIVAGESAVVIATQGHRNALVRILQSRGLDVSNVIDQGRYIALDAAGTLAKFMRGDWPDPELFKETIGPVLARASMAAQRRLISAFGEMVAVLCTQGHAEAAVKLEQLWNGVAEGYSLSLLCAYPMSGFDREHNGNALSRICAEHSHVIPAESYSALINESEKDRLRTIAELQKKAQALENEIAERKQAEEKMHRTKAVLEDTIEQRTGALRQLSARLLRLQDIERRRIARELHDSLGQYLVGLKLNIDMLRQFPREDLWSETEQLMQRCISEVRTLSYLLHPPTMDEAGFVSAARWYVEGFAQRSGVKVTLDTPRELDRLPDALELALFRVLQESLTNVHRHSGASKAHVLILQDKDKVLLEVRDNGRGLPKELLTQFDATGAGLGVGLAGVRERAREFGGHVTLESDHNGTLVGISIPYSTDKRIKK